MSGETENAVSGWTVDTLHAHIVQRFDDLVAMLDERYATQVKALDAAFNAAERAVQAALLSAEKAVTKAEVAQEKRLEGVNEFRAQLTDQAATFIRREEVDIRFGAMADRLNETNTRVTKIEENKLGATASRGAMYAFAGAAVGIIGLVLAIIVALGH